VIFADRQGVVHLWNRGAETMFEYSADEALGQLESDHPGALSRPTLRRLPSGHGYRVTSYGQRLLTVPAMR
jgi:PAS domain-containing protein